jgi:peptide chain release factor 3
VLEYRLKNEYNVEVSIDHLPFKYIRWVKNPDFSSRNTKLTTDTMIAKDKDDNFVLLFQNEWSINTVQDRNKELEMTDILSR